MNLPGAKGRYGQRHALPTAGEEGATAVEYALLVALIAGVIVAIVITLGGQVADLYNLLVGAF